MYLVDTNVWLERFLEQAKAEEVREFLDRTPSDQLCLTDFALHSIGIVLARLGKPEAFVLFVRDTLLDGAVSLVRLDPEDMQALVGIMEQYRLDFDDAYQYKAAEKYGLVLVSFDSDFDRTTLGRKTPEQVLQER
ncbi:tRNA(fMet)-specific endonuclease VapC [bacterium HR10]|nr:tRNA(fMet)-specific endonuclease VapC [bacterium HR10]